MTTYPTNNAACGVQQNATPQVSHKTLPIIGKVTEILPPTVGSNSRGSYMYQPIVVEWDDIYDQGNATIRKVTNKVKVSLSSNVTQKILICVGDIINIPYPQYVIREKNGFHYQNINASFVEIQNRSNTQSGSSGVNTTKVIS